MNSKEMTAVLGAAARKCISTSLFRKNVHKLMLGEVAVFDCTNPIIKSTKKGSEIFTPKRIYERCVVDTFCIDVRKKIRWNDIRSENFYHQLVNDFVRVEEEEIMKRLYNADDIIYDDSPNRKSLQKFFKDLGKNVVILPKEKILDVDMNLRLIVRNDVEAASWQDVSNAATEICIWEEIGFMCDIVE